MSLTYTDKQIPTSLPTNCACRIELMHKFKEASQKQYIYIFAPAGYGKTVSTLLWIKKFGFKSIWITLDAYDNTTLLFYRLFCQSILSNVNHDQEDLQLLKSHAFAAAPVEYSIDLLTRLIYGKEEYILVLDDFQLITNDEIEKSLPFVLKRFPRNVKVCILSRKRIPESFQPLFEQNKISWISAEDLAVKANEIRRYFASYGKFLSQEEASNIEAYTGGWMIAVNAMAMGGSEYKDFKTPQISLESYIEKNVWNKLDNVYKEFLLKTSVVDKFSVELCEKLTESKNYIETLDMLVRGNINLTLIGTEYHYHHLFLNFLRKKMNENREIDKNYLTRQAASHYYNIMDYKESLKYYIKCNDKTGVVNSLKGYLSADLISSNDIFQLFFINELPENILNDFPFLYGMSIWYSFLFGNAKDMLAYLDKLYKNADMILQDKKISKFILFSMLFDFRYGGNEQVKRFKKEDLDSMGEYPVPRSLAHNMPFFHRSYRDFSYIALDWQNGFQEFDDCYSLLIGDEILVIREGVKAGLLYEKNELENALQTIDTIAVSDIQSLQMLIFLIRMSILFSMGKREEFFYTKTKAKEIIENQSFYLKSIYFGFTTNYEILTGNIDSAKEWLEQYFIASNEKVELNKIYQCFVTVRAYILLKEYAKAQTLCRRIIEKGNDFLRPLDKAEGLILLSLCKWTTGFKSEAISLCLEVLQLLYPYGFTRVIAQEGKAILPILKASIKKEKLKELQNQNFISFLNKTYIATYEQSKYYKGITTGHLKDIVKLSGQQKKILELLGTGYKNAEIVSITGLSINTVKTHTRIAYQKLEVNNMMDALIKAKELGLIEIN